MKTLIATLVAVTLLGVSVPGQAPRYILTDLGALGPAGQVLYISPNGIVAGAATAANGSAHATLFTRGVRLDLATRGLGGANSIAFGVNTVGQAVGGAETAQSDPTGADFCGFAAYGLTTAGAVCAPFMWQNGVMRILPTLGGNNGTASQINRLGVIAGEAENSVFDPDCGHYQSKPVTWRNGNVQELATFAGDADGVGYAINDAGQVVGATGPCAPFNPAFQLSIAPLHAMLWQADGTPTDLGSLGGPGYVNPNLAININNSGHVVGTSGLPGDVGGHAFLWTPETGMQDLGTLPGDLLSGAVGINDADVIVGVSIDAAFDIRPFVLEGGNMTDLNTAVPSSRLRLVFATSINDRGQIAGLAVNTRTGALHGYVATPIGTSK